MNTRLLLLAAILVGLGGCATATQIYTPDGKVGHSITCSGAGLTWGNCYEKAGEICGPRGYLVLTGGAEQGAVMSGAFAGTTMTRNMVIQCKG